MFKVVFDKKYHNIHFSMTAKTLQWHICQTKQICCQFLSNLEVFTQVTSLDIVRQIRATKLLKARYLESLFNSCVTLQTFHLRTEVNQRSERQFNSEGFNYIQDLSSFPPRLLSTVQQLHAMTCGYDRCLCFTRTWFAQVSQLCLQLENYQSPFATKPNIP